MTARGALPGRLEVWFERDEGMLVLGIAGDVDLGNAEQLSSSLRTAAAAPEELVILDLLGVPFMDSSGLKAMLVAAQDLGSRLAVVLTADSAVAVLLELAEVRDRFSLHETVDAALAAFGREAP
jgi:anti-anti-sigma factor